MPTTLSTTTRSAVSTLSMSVTSALRFLGCLTGSGATAADITEAIKKFEQELGVPLTGGISDANLIRMQRVLVQRGHGDSSRWPPLVIYREAEIPPVTVSGRLHMGGNRSGIVIEVLLATIGKTSSEMQHIASTTTTPHGEFHVVVPVPQRTPVQLSIKGAEVGTATTPPRLASHDTWIEWGDSEATSARPSRFEIQQAVLLGSVEEKPIDQLQDSPDRQDVELLAELTGIPVRDIIIHVVAARLARELGIDVELTYLLAQRATILVSQQDPQRSEQSVTVGSHLERLTHATISYMLSNDASCVQSDVEEAIKFGAVSERIRERLPQAIRVLEDKQFAAFLDQPIHGGLSWRALLLAAGLQEDQITSTALLLGREPDEEKWRKAAKTFGEPQVKRIRTCLRIAELVGRDDSLVRVLLEATDRQAKTALHSDDPIRNLAALSDESIYSMLSKKGLKDASRAATISSHIDRACPSDVLIRLVLSDQTKRVSTKSRTASKPKTFGLSTATQQFLRRHRDLDLRTAKLPEMLADDRMVNSTPKVALAIARELGPLQRIVRLTNSGRDAHVLLVRGYDSAQSIAFSNVREICIRTGLDEARVEKIYARAHAHYRASVSLYLNHSKHANQPGLPVPRGTDSRANAEVRKDDARSTLLSSFPSYEFLFGPQPDCVCEDWDSVTSPAAYLVDLLVWLKGAPENINGVKPYDELLRRRPDLIRILLDQRNTETEVPYIDLACELLEDEIRIRQGRLTAQDRITQLCKRQTRAQSVDIQAYPEHLNKEVYSQVYDFLSTCTATMHLPFDLSITEVRAYLKQCDVSRLDLIMAFGDTGLSGPVDLITLNGPAENAAAEIWGLNQADVELITEPKPTLQPTIWGFDPGITKLVPVNTLLTKGLDPKRPREHLTYETLQSLLDGEFVDPTHATQVRLKPGEKVDTGKLADRYVGDWSKDSLDRLHRILRLSRHTAQWSIAELDLLLCALSKRSESGGAQVNLLDKSCLIRLALVAEASQTLQLGPEEVAYLLTGFFQSQSHSDEKKPHWHLTFHGRPSLYARLFVPPSDPDVPRIYTDPNFAATSKVKLSYLDERGRLCAALGVPENELRLLLREEQELSGDERRLLAGTPKLDGKYINPASLGELYRHVRLSKSLALPMLDLLPLFQPIVGGSPFSSIENLVTFVRVVQSTLAEGFTKDELALFVGASSAPVAPDTKMVENNLQALHDSLTKTSDLELKEALRNSWIAIVASWLGLDAQCSAILTGLEKVSSAQFSMELLNPASRQDALHTTWRAARLFKVLRMSVEEFVALLALPNVLALLKAPSTAKLRSALSFVSVIRNTPVADSFAQFVTMALSHDITNMTSGGLSAWKRELSATLSGILQIDSTVILSAWNDHLGNTQPDAKAFVSALKRPEHYMLLIQRAHLVSTLGVSHDVLALWVRTRPDSKQATHVCNAVRARRLSSWLSDSTVIQQSIRPAKRDALVSYLLATAKEGQPRTSGDLYGELLIDVEMQAIKTTSRIAQANAAIQLFVQRCFLGLEPVFAPDWKDSLYWQQWTWRKRYRLWEANRLIFLYPENFLNSARRSGASPLFEDFLKTVQQDGALVAQTGDEVRSSQGIDERVSAALESYLSGLEEIANLDYATVSTNGNELGLVGRTRGMAPRHFYRKLTKGLWTPWEEIAIGEASSHLELAQHNGRALLVWPTFSDYPNPAQKLPTASEVEKDTPPPPPGALTYLRFSWTTRDPNGEWSPVRMTSRAMLYLRRASRSVFVNAFTPSVSGIPESFGIGVYLPAKEGRLIQLGQMNITRDTIGSWAFANTMNLGLKAIEEVNADLQSHLYELSHTNILLENTVGAEFWPWEGMTFDNNRLTQGSKGKTLTVNLKTDSGPIKQVSLLTPPFPVAATAEAWGTSGSPKSDVFALTSGNWSLLAICRYNSEPGHEGKPSILHKALLDITADTTTGQYTIIPLYHPFASELRQTAASWGLAKLFLPETQINPGSMGRPAKPYSTLWGLQSPSVPLVPEEAIEFDEASAYGLYNWELFFHAPMVVADQLRAGQRYMEAQRYLHFIFNPFSPQKTDAKRPRAKYWMMKEFAQRTKDAEEAEDISDIIINAADKPDPDLYKVSNEFPFDANQIARTRHTTYQKHVVMRYLDNLIAWGDSLYRTGEPEDINESLQHYLLAEAILGEPPQRIPPLRGHRSLAFADANWIGGSNALVELENLIVDVGDGVSEGTTPVHLPVLADPDSKALYFRIPTNSQLLEYWTTVAQRLENIRNSKTIDGVYKKIPLLSAKINPAALAEAVAAGISVADAIAMTAAKAPPYRFRTMLAKAQEYCNEVKALGSALLSALEKRDAEGLSRLRSAHEKPLLDAMRRVKECQRDQGLLEIEAMMQQQVTLRSRASYYGSRKFMNDSEREAFYLSITAAALDSSGFVFDVLGSALYLIPYVNLGIAGFGGSPNAGAQTGGHDVGSSAGQSSQGLSKLAGILDRATSMLLTKANYERRQEEWTFQAEQAFLELLQLEKQITAAKLRVAVAEAELASHAVQEDSWLKTDRILREKFTNEDLYDWMAKVLAELYRQAYEQAYEMKTLAERCLTFEFGEKAAPTSNDGWNRLKQGLLGGEALAKQLRTLETRYLTESQHDYQITQHVPLSHVDAQALFDLRTTGRCTFTIPAWWLKHAYPKLTNRRIRSVSVSIPGITGPYSNVNACLTLTGPDAASLPVLPAIYLSSGMNDRGCDTTSASERYQPFEGAKLDAPLENDPNKSGTTWSLEFPTRETQDRQTIPDTTFDVGSISDVVLHLEYVADHDPSGTTEGPANPFYLVDLKQMASDAWVQLTTQHKCTFEPNLPSFLSGYRIATIDDHAALTKDWTDYGSLIRPSVLGNAISLELKDPRKPCPWNELRRLLLLLKLEK